MKMKLFLALVALLSLTARAETLTVCDGTNTSSILPFDGNYNYDECTIKSQMIYPAEMLTDMVGCTITHITFYPTDGLHFYGGRLCFNLSKTTKANYADLEPVNLSGLYALTFPDSGLPALVFELGEPFVYRGGNLVLEISIFERGNCDGSTSFYGTDMDYYASLYYANGNGPSGETFLPKATFTYQENNTPEPPTPDESETFTVNGVSFKMINVDGGTFMMGASDDVMEASDKEKPAHEVTLSSFGIGETEVTQELWTAVMGNNPSYKTDNPQYPVEEVSWVDCQNFISKMNELTGRQFRLPTEAEWEFAARGGNKSQGYQYSGSNTYYQVMWCAHNSVYESAVALKAPNELGVYDMSGNVWEWCQDWYGDYTSEAQINPTGPDYGNERVRRGGGWSSWPEYCRVSYRSSSTPTHTTNVVGLRLALTVESTPAPTEQTVAPEVFTWNGTQSVHTYYVQFVPIEENCEMEYRYKFNDDEWTEWTPYDGVLEFTEVGFYEVEGRAKAPNKEWSEATSVTFSISTNSGIDEISGNKDIVSVRYYNMTGQEMAQPQGMTIKVITFADGTTSTEKLMK